MSIQKYGDFLFFYVKFHALNLRYTIPRLQYVSIEAQELDRGAPAAPPAFDSISGATKNFEADPKLENFSLIFGYPLVN